MKKFKKSSLFSHFLLSFFLVLTFSCQQTEKSQDPKKPLSLESLQNNLPSPWSLKISPLNDPPPEWSGPTAKGIKVEIYNSDPQILKEEEKSYKKLYPKSKKSQKMRPQFIRYLYTKLEAGYSFGMMQRLHPAILEGVTQKYVVIKPPFVSSEKDYNVPKSIETLFYKTINFSLTKPFKQATTIKKAFDSKLRQEMKAGQIKHSEKKVIIFIQ